MSRTHTPMGNTTRRVLTLATLFGVSFAAWSAGADLGQAVKQATNWTAISMFAIFVVATLFITKWAAAKTKSGSRLLHRRRRHHRLPERPGDRRRLHVGGLVPGYLRPR